MSSVISWLGSLGSHPERIAYLSLWVMSFLFSIMLVYYGFKKEKK